MSDIHYAPNGEPFRVKPSETSDEAREKFIKPYAESGWDEMGDQWIAIQAERDAAVSDGNEIAKQWRDAVQVAEKLAGALKKYENTPDSYKASSMLLRAEIADALAEYEKMKGTK